MRSDAFRRASPFVCAACRTAYPLTGHGSQAASYWLRSAGAAREVLEINRRPLLGLYALAFIGDVRHRGLDRPATTSSQLSKRHWVSATVLGLPQAAVLAALVCERRTRRLDLAGSSSSAHSPGAGSCTESRTVCSCPCSRSSYVFATFAGTRLSRHFAGKVVIGIAALAASLAMTAVYHSGYSDFRSDKMAKPLTGDVIWSAPTLLTLKPIGAPIAQAAHHTCRGCCTATRPTRSCRRRAQSNAHAPVLADGVAARGRSWASRRFRWHSSSVHGGASMREVPRPKAHSTRYGRVFGSLVLATRSVWPPHGARSRRAARARRDLW